MENFGRSDMTNGEKAAELVGHLEDQLEFDQSCFDDQEGAIRLALNNAELRGREKQRDIDAKICEHKTKWLGAYDREFIDGWEKAQEKQAEEIRKQEIK